MRHRVQMIVAGRTWSSLGESSSKSMLEAQENQSKKPNSEIDHDVEIELSSYREV